MKTDIFKGLVLIIALGLFFLVQGFWTIVLIAIVIGCSYAAGFNDGHRIGYVDKFTSNLETQREQMEEIDRKYERRYKTDAQIIQDEIDRKAGFKKPDL